MLSIKALKSASLASHYYSEEDAKYYVTNEQTNGVLESAGLWHGKGAALLGLKGVVCKQTFMDVLEGKLPNGILLGRQQEGKTIHAPGLDLTFSCPKSVSIMAEVAQDERIKQAFLESVKTTLGYVEKNFIYTRVQEGGTKSLKQTNNLTIALFTHNTSRNLDPNLHIHAVVANVTRQDLSKWKSPELKPLFENKMLLGQIQRFELAYRLKSLGYEIEITGKNSIFELKCVPKEVREAFSTRREQIKAALKNYDYINAKTAENATLVTRAKKQEVSMELLRERWHTVSKNLGFDTAAVKQTMEPKTEQETVNQDATIRATETPENIETKALNYAISHISERTSLWRKEDMLSSAMHYSLGSCQLSQLNQKIDEMVAGHQLLVKSEGSTKKTYYYTTKEALKLERDTITWMKMGIKAQKPVLTQKEAKTRLKDSKLNQGQKDAANLILSSKDRILGVCGYAGTGKTYMLNTARLLASEEGYRLIGLAPSSSAAANLQKEAGITSCTIHKFLFKYSGLIHGRGTLEGKQAMRRELNNTILIVDEASLASTTQVDGLCKVANELDVKLVLIGDTKQLAAVEAGRPFTEMQRYGMQVAKMREIQRQKSESLKEAVGYALDSVDELDQGLITKALDKIGNNFIQAQSLHRAAADNWLKLDLKTREDTLLVAPSNIDRKAINDLIRNALKDEGALKGPEIINQILESRGFTKAQSSHAPNYEVGDVVLFNRSYLSLKVQKNTYWQVQEVKPHGVIILRKYDKGLDIELNKQTLIKKLMFPTGATQVAWRPDKVGGNREAAVEVFSTRLIKIAEGERIRWTKNFENHNISNSHLAQIIEISNNSIKVKLESGEIRQIAREDNVLKHLDHAYAITTHSAQGKTYSHVIGILESVNQKLSTQRMLYVTLSRAKESAMIITDDKAKLIKTLTLNSGAKLSAIEKHGYEHSMPTQTGVKATRMGLRASRQLIKY